MNKTFFHMTINFEDDHVEATFTGEEIEDLVKCTPEARIRPRHIKVINEIQELMKEYRKQG